MSLKFSPLQAAAHLGAWLPALLLVWDAFTDGLTFNPIQYVTLRTGKAALVLLVLSLACTPANSLFGWRQAIKVRRPLGVYAALYVCVHLLIFVWVDYGLNWGLIYGAIFEKPFALVGFAAFLILAPLALTSTRGWQKRLGRNWKRLHKLVYVAAPLAVLHYTWSVKSDYREPLTYGAIVAALLIVRLPAVKRGLKAAGRALLAATQPRPAPPPPPAQPSAPGRD